MPLPVRRRQASRPRARTLVFAVVACWLIVLAAPVGAQTPGDAAPPTGGTPEIAASTGGEPLEVAGTDPAGDGDQAAGRELVLGLVAIILLGVTIGLHALYRDRD